MFTMMNIKCQKSTKSQKENLRETGNSKLEQCVKPQIQDQLKRGVNKFFQLIQVPLHVFESMSIPLLPCKLHQAC